MSHIYEVNGLALPNCSYDELLRKLQEEGLTTDLVSQSLEQAAEAHDGQLRDSGRFFLDEHVFPVTVDAIDYLKKRGKPLERIEVVASATLLHDTIEANPDNQDRIFERINDTRVTNLVYLLTKYRGNNNNNGIFLDKLYNSSKDARIISVLERINNLTCSIVNVTKLPEKLEDYAAQSELDYLPIADTILDHNNSELDKELYRRLRGMIDLSRLVLSSSAVEVAE